MPAEQGFPENLGRVTTHKEGVFNPENLRNEVVGKTVDSLVIQGIKQTLHSGERINVTAGTGLQAYGVNFTLLDPTARVHTLRAPVSTSFQAAEMIAFFKGSLSIDDGLEAASVFWGTNADDERQIQSNYGHYVFHQILKNESGETTLSPEGKPMTQYDWVIYNLNKNLQSRKAFINLNQPMHKKPDIKDFPCVTGAQFFVRGDDEGNPALCCDVSSRSTDLVTGLPYNLSFFSTLQELVCADLVQRGHKLKLGYMRFKPSFVQLYDRCKDRADQMLDNPSGKDMSPFMAPITDAQATLTDIYQGTAETEFMQWLYNAATTEKRRVEGGVVYRIGQK